MGKYDIPKKARNKYGFVKSQTPDNYITTQQMMVTSGAGGGAGGGTVINNQWAVAIGNQINEKSQAAKDDSYSYIGYTLSQLSYVTQSELSNMSYVTKTELDNASYVTESQLQQAAYVTKADLEPVSYVIPTDRGEAATNDDFIVVTQAYTNLTLPYVGVDDGQVITVINTSGAYYNLISNEIIDKQSISDQRTSTTKQVSTTATQYIYYNGAWWEIS